MTPVDNKTSPASTKAKVRTLSRATAGSGLFTRAYLLRELRVSASQFSAWERAGWISAGESGRYSSTDLLTLKTLLRLRRGGVPAGKLRAIHDALIARFNALGIRRPFSELHLSGQNKRVLLTLRGARMEPLTGQMLLDYSGEAAAPAGRTVTMPAPKATAGKPQNIVEAAERARRAERFFTAALRQEGLPGGLPKAIRGYRRAIELNPQALGALLNLGTLYYNQRLLPEAEQCYRAALQVNPRSSLAHFNMGNLADESGQPLKAIEHYEQAIALDAKYPDPRYNLALVYEKLGRHGQAWKNWRGYLKLDPDSKWAELARNRLAQQDRKSTRLNSSH